MMLLTTEDSFFVEAVARRSCSSQLKSTEMALRGSSEETVCVTKSNNSFLFFCNLLNKSARADRAAESS